MMMDYLAFCVWKKEGEKINVEQQQDLASHFMVRGVPTLMLFKSGKMLWRQSGVLSTKDLVAIIQNHLN